MKPSKYFQINVSAMNILTLFFNIFACIKIVLLLKIYSGADCNYQRNNRQKWTILCSLEFGAKWWRKATKTIS